MTQIVSTYIDHMGSDLSVVNAARVSFGKESEWEMTIPEDAFRGEHPDSWQWVQLPSGEHALLYPKDQNLIRYLAKHGHYSPFGHCFMSFHVKAPVFVRAQLVKHQYLRVNEISRRYVDDEPEFYIPDVWRGRSADKKQGSEGEVDDRRFALSAKSKEICAAAFDEYKHFISRGVAPEQARMMLPQSMMTEFYWSGSLDAFASMCNLRLKEDAQYESRLVAQQIDEKASQLFPHSWKALVHGED